MSRGGLSSLQHKVLLSLADVEPSWTLTGGAALILFLSHRQTRDIDLRWSHMESIASVSRVIRDRLITQGFSVSTIQTGNRFERLLVESDGEGVVLDLMAEPFPPVEQPIAIELGEATILADTVHSMLVNKLCALLGRTELRDLIDVRQLLGMGVDLDRALRDAPEHDAGFSPLTLAWVLHGFSVVSLARALGWTDEEAAGLDDFRQTLIAQLTLLSAPEHDHD
jgi:hypothetical protein